MRFEIKGFAELRQRLEQVKPAEIMERALAEQAQALAEAVRERLSEPQGAGSHDTPWVRTGALRDSIAATANGLEAAIGSNDPAAAPQEMGTARIPPRPFLAPAAAALGAEVAHSIGQAIAAGLKGYATPGLQSVVESSAASSQIGMRAGPSRGLGGAVRAKTAPSRRNESASVELVGD